MAKEKYYWVDASSTFGGGVNPIQAGDEMPAEFQDDERFESFKAQGLISTEKVASKRQLSELEELRKENADLKKNQGGGSEISQKDLDEAQGESVQGDLDEIDELGDQLEAIKSSVENIQQGDSKDEIWKAVKSVKDLFKGDK